MPIVLIHHSISKSKLAALYKFADICLVTSSRDGMNLVALEYISVKSKYGVGTLILSEFTGASKSLGNNFIVNPWNIEETADSINKAILEPANQKIDEMKRLSKYVKNFSSSHWAEAFLHEVQTRSKESSK